MNPVTDYNTQALLSICVNQRRQNRPHITGSLKDGEVLLLNHGLYSSL